MTNMLSAVALGALLLFAAGACGQEPPEQPTPPQEVAPMQPSEAHAPPPRPQETPDPSSVKLVRPGPPAPLPGPEMGKELSTVPGVSIRRVTDFGTPAAYKVSDGGIEAKAWTLLGTIMRAHDPGLRLFDNAAPLPLGRYDITVKADRQQCDLWERLAETYEKAFGVRIHEVTRPVGVYVLSLLPGQTPRLGDSIAPGSWTYSSNADGYSFRGVTMSRLAAILSEQYTIPVRDEMNLEGSYSFEVAAKKLTLEATVAGLRELGLDLKKETRTIRVIAIDRPEGSPAAAPEATQPAAPPATPPVAPMEPPPAGTPQPPTNKLWG